MKYALLIYTDPNGGPADGSPEQMAEMQKWFGYSQEAGDAGVLLGGEGLQGTETATSVKVQDGNTITADGPFAETKELLGGFYLLDLPDMDAAIAWAEKIPSVGYGTVEIRPVMEYPTD
ncbi:MAG: YciI family protein [Acidimicrobiales bacterium]